MPWQNFLVQSARKHIPSPIRSQRCDRYGLPLAPVLERLAAEAVDSRRRLGEIDARKLPIRLAFPLVATVLPSFVLIALAPAVIGALSTLSIP